MSKNVKFLFSSPRLSRNRGRAMFVSTGIVVGLVLILFAMPVPLRTLTEGVIWPPEQSQLRTGADGVIEQVLVPDGRRVEQGEALIAAEDAFLAARVDLLESHQRELELQVMLAQTVDQVQVAILREELSAVTGDLDRAREQARALTIRSPRAGVFIVPDRQDLPGRFVRKGQTIGYVIDSSDHLTVRAAVSQDNIGLLRERIRKVNVLQSEWSGRDFEAELRRAVPGGTRQLPTAALGTLGGGSFAVDPRDSEGRQVLERVFEFELALPPDAPTEFIGNRVYVRFDHGYEPLGFQLYRSARQLLLSRFGV